MGPKSEHVQVQVVVNAAWFRVQFLDLTSSGLWFFSNFSKFDSTLTKADLYRHPKIMLVERTPILFLPTNYILLCEEKMVGGQTVW